MKFVTNLNRTALALAAATTLALSACSSSGVTVPDGDYAGAAVYQSDESHGYVNLSVIVDGGTVTGTATIYDFLGEVCSASIGPRCPGWPTSVPSSPLTYDITGTTDGDQLDLVLTDGDATFTATLKEDGTLSGGLFPTDPPANFISHGMIYPDSGSETGFACGDFFFGPLISSFSGTTGEMASLVTEDGSVFSVFLSDSFEGALAGTYDGGTACSSTSCNNAITGAVSGTLDGISVTFDDFGGEESDVDFLTKSTYGPYTYVNAGGTLRSDAYSGSMNSSTGGCLTPP